MTDTAGVLDVLPMTTAYGRELAPWVVALLDVALPIAVIVVAGAVLIPVMQWHATGGRR